MLASAVSLVLTAGVLALLDPGVAAADSAPPATTPATPTTVAADGLPTTQINGVVWSQVVVGNTVYAAGSFTRARPAGAAAGTQETVRNNLLSYDITTGALNSGFAPNLNAQALVVTASPDGSRIYVGGDFTTANGQTRNKVAAYSTATGALIDTFRPSVNGQVRALAATNDTVYFGGSLSAVGGVSRSRLAAVSAATGALLPWAPVPGVGPTSGNRDGNTATSNVPMAMVVTGGGNQVVVAGRFDSMNGVKATGVAALDPVSGANRPFAVNQLITNQGVNSAVYSLSTDGTTVYGSAYDYYGPGDLEGTFAATANGGALIEVNDCNGDTYSTFPMNGALYVASHTHNCEGIGGSIEQNPRVEKRGTAYTLTPVTVVRWGRDVHWVGKPAGEQLAWNPDISQGSYTGQYQGGWSVTGNAQYVVYGGEFPRINNVAQQGLVRFAVPTIAPNRVGPQSSGFATTATVTAPGTVRIGWRETWDYDNEYLTYRVYRDDDNTVIGQVTRGSRWFDLQNAGFSDVGVTGAHRYRVRAVDPFGNAVASAWTATVTATGAAVPRPYVAAVAADGATDHWSLGEASGSTAYADVGSDDLALGTGVARAAGGGIAGDPDTASTFNGTSAGFGATRTARQSPNAFSVEAWFRTTSTSGGKIVGFGNASTGTSSVYDRHVYMDSTGRVLFGVVEMNQRRTISSATRFNDGAYHHVVASLSPATGMQLFVDGVRVANASTPVGQNYYGFWRVGGDSTWSGSGWFNGRIDEVAIYPTVLSAIQVSNHRALGTGGGVVNQPPSASFTATPSNLVVGVNASASTDADGTVASYAWNWGDGSSTPASAGATNSHTYAAPGTYTVTLTVVDNDGTPGTTTRAVTVTAPPNAPPVAEFTATPTGLSVAFSAAPSTDDGSIVGWSWNFGDGQTSTAGPTTSHGYAAAGSYPVTLTVTDDHGATGQVSHDVVVTDTGGPAVLASDTFQRTVTNGLGTADVGGPWTADQSSGARQSVTPGAAAMTLPTAGINTTSFLGGVSATSVDVRTSFSVDTTPTGNGTYVYVTGRRISSNNEYRVRVRLLADGRVALALSRLTSATTPVEAFPGGEVILAGLTYTAGQTLNVHVQVSGTGTTQIAGTVWAAGGTEPATPSIVRTDTTAVLQAAGAVGLLVHRDSSTTAATTVRFSAFTATAGP